MSKIITPYDAIVAQPWVPRPIQHHALTFGIERDAAGLFMTPGFGKTAIAYALMLLLQTHYGARRILVICPLRPLHQVWPKERLKWEEFNDMNLVLLHGPHKERALTANKEGIFVINPEGLTWLFSKPRRLRDFDTVIYDESTKFKNSQSGRFKLIKPHVNDFSFRYLLSGTPRPRSLENLFSQIFLLDGGLRLGSFITHFRRKYMYDDAPRGADYSDWIPVPGAEDDVYKLIDDVAMTVTDDDYAGSPPFVENVISIELPANARREYKRMARQTVALINSKVITPKNAGGRNSKLRQISSGFMYDNEKVSEIVHFAKIAALLDLADEFDGRPMLISVEYKAEYFMIRDALKDTYGIDVPYFGQGGVPASKTQHVIDAWNAGLCPFIVAHPASAGHGIDGLQESGSDVVFFSLTYDFELYDQIRRRLKRTGQVKPTVLHFLECDGTIDEHIRTDIIQKREGDQNKFFRVLRKHATEAAL